MLDTYHDTVLAPLQAAAHVRLLRLDKAPEAPEESFRLVSAAYCAANALDVLAETPDTLSRLAADGVLARALVGILSAGAAHEAVEREAWQLLSRLAHADTTCAYRGRVLAEWLAKEALLRLELTGHEADKERIERERRFVSNAVTGIGGFARRFRPEASVGPVLDLAARILRLDPASHGGALADATLVGQVAPTALLLAYSLAAGCPEASRGHQGFVRALIGRMAGGEPASFGDAALVVLHRTRPLVEYAPEIVEACSALQPRSPVLEVVQEIVADLFVGQCEMEEPEVDEEVLDGGNADVREVPHEPEEALEADQGIAQRMEEGMEREIEQNAEQDAPGEVEQEVDQGAEQEFFVGGDDLIAEEQQES